MAQDQITLLVAAMSRAGGLQDVRHILQELKSHIVGHAHRKESAVRAGIVEPLVNIIVAAQNDLAYEDILLQDVVQILGLLASAGRQIVVPLLDAKVDKHLMQILATEQWVGIRDAAISALEQISTARATHGTPETRLDLEILTTETVPILHELLRTVTSANSAARLRRLIAQAAVTEEHQTLLLNAGILDTLGTSFAEYAGKALASLSRSKTPALLEATSILRAICAIVEGSCYRTQYFVHLPAIRKLCNDLNEQRSIQLPDLGTARFALKPAGLAMFASDAAKSDAQTSHLSVLTSLLLVLARSSGPVSRMGFLRMVGLIEAANTEAALLLPQIFDHQDARARERQLALLAVPLCTTLLDEALDGRTCTEAEQPLRNFWKVLSCSTLALLMEKSRELQNTAAQAGAVRTICAALKSSFETITLTKPIWAPRGSASDDTFALSDAGLSHEINEVMNQRQSALLAIAAIANKDEDHRKEVIMAGAVPYLIDALKPMSKDGTIRQLEGNTIGVILAACLAVRSISKSVANLRTSLIDGGITTPIFELLSHPDANVQVAATDVCANFVLEMSPMREDLVNLDIISILARNAKNGDPGMRHSSLWAVKHLLLKSDLDLKNRVLNELGLDFIMSAAHGQPVEDSIVKGGAIALSTANAAGEQVDLLNPLGMDVDGPFEQNDVEDDDYADEDGELKYDDASKTHYHDSSMRSTLYSPLNLQKHLTLLRQAEENTEYQARRMDIAIQEQALDIIRNLIHGDDCATMLNKILNEVGAQSLWDLLLPKISPVPGRHRTGRNGETKPVYQPTEIVASALHVMNHIANGNSAHKELITSAKPLLRALLPHFDKTADPSVKKIAVFFVSGLIWVHDKSDEPAARRRANELRQLGIESAVKRLANDTVLDIRERVKTAVRQFDTL